MITPDRRLVLAGLAAVGGCSIQRETVGPDPFSRLAPVQARNSRLFDITVCLRPFRAKGPRMDVEKLGDTTVIHNYGHGGSGWSLSWGAAAIALQKVTTASPREIAVIGCGAMGLTTALLAQRAGFSVTVYSKDQINQTRSARATGTWSPDSRIALARDVSPDFEDLWERMARFSWNHYHNYLGLEGDPVEFGDRYLVSDIPAEKPPLRSQPDVPVFASFSERIGGLIPRYQVIQGGSRFFPGKQVEISSALTFNIASYSRTLLNDFYAAGGKFQLREFHSPDEFTRLDQKVVINCTGYGARSLWKDESIVPVRGQVGWLIPQPEVRYGVRYREVQMLSRRDGIAVQAVDGGDLRGYNDDNEKVDRGETESAVGKISEFYSLIAG